MSTKKVELKRSAEMLVDISENQGVYFAVAFIHDSQYHNAEDLKELMGHLQNTNGAIKYKCTCALNLGNCNCPDVKNGRKGADDK